METQGPKEFSNQVFMSIPGSYDVGNRKSPNDPRYTVQFLRETRIRERKKARVTSTRVHVLNKRYRCATYLLGHVFENDGTGIYVAIVA